MTFSPMVLERPQSLDANLQGHLDAALEPLGVRCEGLRGRELVLEVIDENTSGGDDFARRLVNAILDSPEARVILDQIDSISFN